MSTNPGLYQHFKGYEELLRRIDDYVEQSDRYQKARITPFLRLNEVEAVKRYLGNRVEYRCDGGYEGSEMQRIVIGDNEADAEIVCLYAKIANKAVKIEHRDVYGALMNQGMKREQFGDVFIKDDLAVIYCTKESAQFIKDNLISIHRVSVSFTESETPIANEVHLREFEKSVAAYRLDSCVSAMCNLSRAKAQQLIRGKMVSVNHEVLEETDYLCNNEDTISVRGYGRFIVLETIGTTRKNRLVIRFGKYE